MNKKILIGSLAVALVLTVAVFAIGDAGQASACDGKTKTASASGCTKTASAAKVSAGSQCTQAQLSACSQSAKACCAKMARQASYTEIKDVADDIPGRVNTRIVVTGTYKCGSCDLGQTKKCQAFLKTAEGNLYPLEKNAKVKELKASKGKEFEVVGRVHKEGGIKFLSVTSAKAL
ncbi:MAG: hypothetical protein KAJ37_06235, partial [Candidatus Krumholzibacteria bacterium]|nr:hypothetical protein [Candidatus Krumholzibacteria bacterium]